MNGGWHALLLSLGAGLGTALGGALVIAFVRFRSESAVGRLQGVSAGVMIYLSFFDILPESRQYVSSFECSLYFFMGMLAMGLLDHFFPEELLNHLVLQFSSAPGVGRKDSDQIATEDSDDDARDAVRSGSNSTILQQSSSPSSSPSRNYAFLRAGWITFIGMALHNTPEGVAVYLSTLKDHSFGASLALAMACHNIPEGMAVAIPMFLATKDRWKTFRLTLINGLFEPLAVLICLIIFGSETSLSADSDRIVSRMLAAVAGVMFFISAQELYPSAIQYSGPRAILYLSIGMLIGWIISEASHH